MGGNVGGKTKTTVRNIRERKGEKGERYKKREVLREGKRDGEGEKAIILAQLWDE